MTLSVTNETPLQLRDDAAKFPLTQFFFLAPAPLPASVAVQLLVGKPLGHDLVIKVFLPAH